MPLVVNNAPFTPPDPGESRTAPFRGVGVSACLLGAGPTALACSAPKGGKIRVFVTKTSATKGKILITGAIGDYGTTVSQDANGKADPNGNSEKVTLKHGGFLVDGTALNQKLNSAMPTINQTNCSFAFTGTGPNDGQGRHRRLRGHHRQSGDHRHLRGYRAENATGCNLADNAPTFAGYQSITGTGNVSFK